MKATLDEHGDWRPKGSKISCICLDITGPKYQLRTLVISALEDLMAQQGGHEDTAAWIESSEANLEPLVGEYGAEKRISDDLRWTNYDFMHDLYDDLKFVVSVGAYTPKGKRRFRRVVVDEREWYMRRQRH